MKFPIFIPRFTTMDDVPPDARIGEVTDSTPNDVVDFLCANSSPNTKIAVFTTESWPDMRPNVQFLSCDIKTFRGWNADVIVIDGKFHGEFRPKDKIEFCPFSDHELEHLRGLIADVKIENDTLSFDELFYSVLLPMYELGRTKIFLID